MTIKTALQDWIMASLGYDDQHVILEKGSGGMPTGDFATFDILTVLTGDYSDKRQTDLGGGDLQVNHLTRNQLTVVVNDYSKSALDHLLDLGMSSNLWTSRNLLGADNLSLLKSGDPQNIAEPFDTGWKARYLCEFTILSYHTLTEIQAQIQAYDFTGKFISDENQISTVGFEVNPSP